MRILQLSKKIPYPQKDGETIAIHNITQSLSKAGCSIDVLSILTPKHSFPLDDLPATMTSIANYDAVYVDTSIRILPALLNLLQRSSYNIDRFDHPSVHQRIATLLENKNYDIIQLEGLYLTPYLKTIRQHCQTPVVLRSHNIEFEIWERLASSCDNPIKKIYLKFLANRMKKYELAYLNQYDALVSISEKDLRQYQNFGIKIPCMNMVSGVDTQKLQIDRSQSKFPGIFHLGALDWMPNQEALLWFTEKIWPKVRKLHQDLEFEIVGRNQPDDFEIKSTHSVKVIGEVPSAVDYMNSRTIMVVPLLSGSGMRIKIMEAMALGKTIITTSVGLEGIDAVDGEQVLVANTVEEFEAAISNCLKDPSFCHRIGENAAIFVREQYDNDRMITSLLEFYKQLI